MKQEWLTPAFCQGFRCGHLEGSSQETSFPSNDEIHGWSLEAAEAQTGLGYFAKQEWASGYRYGFQSGGRGAVIPKAIAEAPLPNE